MTVKRLEIEIPEAIHALLLSIARQQNVTAAALGGAIVTRRLTPHGVLHRELRGILHPDKLWNLDATLLATELQLVQPGASDTQ